MMYETSARYLMSSRRVSSTVREVRALTRNETDATVTAKS